MRRLLRWAFNGAAVVSAVACAFLVSAAVAARSRPEKVPDGERGWTLIRNGLARRDRDRLYGQPGGAYSFARSSYAGLVEVTAESVTAGGPGGRRVVWRAREVDLPVSAWAVAAAVLPVLWLSGRWLRHRQTIARIQAGLCPSCGYNLTGNVSGKCSECGAEAPVAKAVP